MKDTYQSFMDEIWSQFPGLSDRVLTDLTDHNVFWSLDDYVKAGHVNFKTGTKELYWLSILLENYAVKHNSSLLATFEVEKRYKYVEDRYAEILNKIPKAWIIGDFKNSFLAPQLPQTVEVVSCDGTNISDMWIAVTSGTGRSIRIGCRKHWRQNVQRILLHQPNSDRKGNSNHQRGIKN